ncbi:MAG: hypothetical protein J5367_00340 [Lachnospiraceae bacterium]|nr:hypothetical protein [Lachnospiraceae bacterium]
MEKQKVDPILMFAAAVALICTAYVLYMTVFEQVISQNQGYFYAVIFGFILLVMFLICNLFTKLVAISYGEQRSSYRKLITTAGLVVIGGLFLVTKMRYTTDLSPWDFNAYNGAVAMVDGTYAENLDLIDSAKANPAEYFYSLILSVVFRFVEPDAGPILWVNAFFILLSGFLVYKIVKTFTNSLCGLFAAALCAFIPSQTFAVYSFSSEPMVAAAFLGATLSLISLYSFNKRRRERYEYGEEDKKDIAGIIYTIVGSIVIGILIFVEPFMIIPVVLMVAVAYFARKEKALSMLVAFAAGIVVFVLLCFVKSSHMETDFGEVMMSEIAAFDPMTNYNSGEVFEFGDVYHSFNMDLSSTDHNILNNYMFISGPDGTGVYTDMSASWVVVLNQIMYMFILMMTISCMILAVKEQKDYVITISMLIVGSVVMLLFQQNRSSQKFLVISVFIIATATGIHYLYLDHHPELKVSINALDALEKTGRKEIAAATRSNLRNAAQMSEADFVRRAQALIFVGNDEELYRQIKEEEQQKSQQHEPRAGIVEDAFDDYDEDFFLDSEDNVDDSQVTVTTVAPSGIRKTVGKNAYEPNAEMHESASAALENPDIPAWKRPEKFGDEVMFDEDDVELGKAHSTFDGRDALEANAGVTTNEPAPVVEKLKRGSKKDKEKKEKDKKEKVKKIDKKAVKAEQTAQTAVSSEGRAVRRIKSVGANGAGVVQTVSVAKPTAAAVRSAVAEPVRETEPVKASKPIPNPLPVPKKKDHKPIDFKEDVKVADDDDWDYDYEFDDDDDWDVD